MLFQDHDQVMEQRDVSVDESQVMGKGHGQGSAGNQGEVLGERGLGLGWKWRKSKREEGRVRVGCDGG